MTAYYSLANVLSNSVCSVCFSSYTFTFFLMNYAKRISKEIEKLTASVFTLYDNN